MSLDNLCFYQNVLYSSLLEYSNASDMVRSDHDSYEHDCNDANMVILTERTLTCHYASLLRLRCLVLLL